MINYAYYMIKKSHVDWIDIKKKLDLADMYLLWSCLCSVILGDR